MAADPLKFRHNALSSLTDEIGCYALADLDNVPIYVGQSRDGIRTRVRRHLTSARSDIVANRQIDVWEVAYVWAYPVAETSQIVPLETVLFHAFDQVSQLMNGTVPIQPVEVTDETTEASQIVQVMTEQDILERQSPDIRLPRQASHYARLVDHYLVVKRSDQIARAMDAHFERLRRYHYLLQTKV